MLALVYLLITVLGLVSGAPVSVDTTACTAKLFNIPWTLTNILLWNTNTNVSATPVNGMIRFDFQDFNDRLQMATTCSGQVRDGVAQGELGGYNPCEDTAVSFEMTSAGRLMVTRAYIDDW
jgi:hypothetical protein